MKPTSSKPRKRKGDHEDESSRKSPWTGDITISLSSKDLAILSPQIGLSKLTPKDVLTMSTGGAKATETRVEKKGVETIEEVPEDTAPEVEVKHSDDASPVAQVKDNEEPIKKDELSVQDITEKNDSDDIADVTEKTDSDDIVAEVKDKDNDNTPIVEIPDDKNDKDVPIESVDKKHTDIVSKDGEKITTDVPDDNTKALAPTTDSGVIKPVSSDIMNLGAMQTISTDDTIESDVLPDTDILVVK